jgi:hypothetical protein
MEISGAVSSHVNPAASRQRRAARFRIRLTKPRALLIDFDRTPRARLAATKRASVPSCTRLSAKSPM